MLLQYEPMIHKINSVTPDTPGVFIVNMEITDVNGERYVCDYVSAPNDPFGLAPEVRKYLVDQGIVEQ